MVTSCRAVIVGFFFWGVIANQVCFGSLSISGPIKVCADRLEELQTKQGVSAGSWYEETSYTGSIVAGLVGAYEAEGDANYKTCAELGGDYILYSAQGNFYGDDAFALSRLSQISNDSSHNIWRTALIDFYFNAGHDVDGTEGYISQFVGAEPSTAVFYIANHVVATYYVHAEDKQIWRQALIDYLAQVDDSSDFPVMGLGVATWALATTGPLDNTLIDPSGAGAAYWNGKKLADLPDLLLSHQVPKGEGYAGSFYWRFDHSGDSPGDAVSGYTEDAIFASLGLMAASQAGEDSILAVREALLRGVGRTGVVWEHLSQQGKTYSAYAGEMLQVLSEIGIPGWAPVGPFIYDLDDDDFIGPGDLSLFACCWLHPSSDSGCSGSIRCFDYDFDCDGFVGPGDLSWFATGWLKRCDDPSVLWPSCQGGVQASGFTAQALRSFTPDVKTRLVTLTSPSSSDTR